MRLLSFICIFLFTILSVSAQESYDLSALQGLRDKNGDLFFEISGYNISVTVLSGKVDDPALIDSLKTKYRIGTTLAEYADFELAAENKVIEAEAKIEYKPSEKFNQILYLIERDGGFVSCIFFQTYNQRDIGLEQVIADAYLANQLQDYISDDWSASKIMFVGREIQLSTDCRWVAPHDMRCGHIRIKWSEFSSYESALLDINNLIRLGNNDQVSIVAEGEIDILFEDIQTVAYRMVSRRNDTDNLVASYYIVQKVDGRYVSCVLSNPVSYPTNYTLHPLLLHIMSIPELPLDAYQKEYVEENSPPVELEILAGTWLPVGSLRKVYKVAPLAGVLVAFPLSEKFYIDCGFQLAIPLDKDRFKYYLKKETLETEAEFVGDILLRARYKKRLSKKISVSPYFGVGVNFMQTDIEKETDDEDSKGYESVTAPNVFLGSSVKYKGFGVFFEYHYVPYSVGSKVRGNFGDSALSIGVSYTFIAG